MSDQRHDAAAQVVTSSSTPQDAPRAGNRRRSTTSNTSAGLPSSTAASSSFQPPPATPIDAPPSATTSSVGQLSPGATDRVFPIRSVVSVDPYSTPFTRPARQDTNGYFPVESPRRASRTGSEISSRGISARQRIGSVSGVPPSPADDAAPSRPRSHRQSRSSVSNNSNNWIPGQLLNSIVTSRSGDSEPTSGPTSVPRGQSAPSNSSGPARSINTVASGRSSLLETEGLVTARFKHIVTEEGHAVITGRDGETLQRCEDEPIHLPGAIQSFGMLIALQEDVETCNLIVRVVSENSKRMIGRSPRELFALDNFCEILSEEQADNLLDHIDFIGDEEADVERNGPEVFTISIAIPGHKSRKFWCAIHIVERSCDDHSRGLIICEFEREDDVENPLVPEVALQEPEDTLDSRPTAEEFAESTEIMSRPLRILRSARRRKGEAAAVEVFNIMAQVQEQLAAAPSLEKLLKVLVGIVKELTGFHRVMVYQFDRYFNGKVVTELVDPKATKDLYKGLNFPASDIPKQARELYKINRVRLLYDREQQTARLVCRTVEDLETPLDLTHAYLRAMSPIHIKYLGNMAVRSSMSISINAFNELWGLIACHSYGNHGMRISFPIRKMCRLIGDSASHNIERLSYASRLQARKLINTVPTQHNPSGYIIASSEDLLKLFDADFGLLSIGDETKILGEIKGSQEALAMLEYLRMRKMTSVTSSQDITEDFPDLRYGPGFQTIAGVLVVPLSSGGNDFIVFFRTGVLKEVKWAGNPYEKFVKEGTEGYLEPRKSFKTWSELVVGKSREWTEEEIETAAVLCLVYGKFIEVWRQKEAALQNSELTRLLLANSAHEVRTPLNAIINYLEIALEGSLDQETRENLAKSHSASKSLIYVINDLLDLTKTEAGGELVKEEVFDLKGTLQETFDAYTNDARRKGISYKFTEHPGVPRNVIGDQRKVRQLVSNLTANAIQNTREGSVQVEAYIVQRVDKLCNFEVAVLDTGVGMSPAHLDALFRELEQVRPEPGLLLDSRETESQTQSLSERKEKKTVLGLGLAVVARILRNMNGQLRLKSEEGKGSRFVIQLPFTLPDDEARRFTTDSASQNSRSSIYDKQDGEVTLVKKDDHRGSDPGLVRRKSAESYQSKHSLRSIRSESSAQSQRSDVDRLIEAIQTPHNVPDSKSMAGDSRRSDADDKLQEKNTGQGGRTAHLPQAGQQRNHDGRSSGTILPPHRRSLAESHDGQQDLPYSIAPVKAIKIPEEPGSPLDQHDSSGVYGEIRGTVEETRQTMSAEHMHVLVAEDDPVNSKIIKKRLEKSGHEIRLTGNGEECATAYGEQPEIFDVILMDMQMPIVDGLTSTKMIRSFEKSHPTATLSARARLNGRIPIIAVSASLVEKDRTDYINAGFDGWILKPISFPRLSEILRGIVDAKAREEALYSPGDWERGGWFSLGQPNIYQANTAPSCKPAAEDVEKVTHLIGVADKDGSQEGES